MTKLIATAAIALVLASASTVTFAAETGSKEWYQRNADDNGHKATKSERNTVRGD